MHAFQQLAFFLTRVVVTQNLTKLLGDAAKGCCKEQKVENYFGRKVAIDASMHIYQFLVGPRSHSLGKATAFSFVEGLIAIGILRWQQSNRAST